LLEYDLQHTAEYISTSDKTQLVYALRLFY